MKTSLPALALVGALALGACSSVKPLSACGVMPVLAPTMSIGALPRLVRVR